MKNKILIPSTTLAIFAGIASGFACASCSKPLPPTPPGPQPEPGDITITPPKNKVFTEIEKPTYINDGEESWPYWMAHAVLNVTFKIDGFKVTGITKSQLNATAKFKYDYHSTQYESDLTGYLKINDPNNAVLELSFSLTERQSGEGEPSGEALAFNQLAEGQYTVNDIKIYDLKSTKPLFHDASNFKVKIEKKFYSPYFDYWMKDNKHYYIDLDAKPDSTRSFSSNKEIYSERPIFRFSHYPEIQTWESDYTLSLSTDKPNQIEFTYGDSVGGLTTIQYGSWFDLNSKNCYVKFKSAKVDATTLKIQIRDSNGNIFYENSGDESSGEPIYLISNNYSEK